MNICTSASGAEKMEYCNIKIKINFVDIYNQCEQNFDNNCGYINSMYSLCQKSHITLYYFVDIYELKC